MAIANAFIFGGVSSKAYGVVIEGGGDYSAPNRAVESVSVPGRNGELLIDQGHYENIEVTYTAVIRAKNQREFAAKISDFRNAIVSQIGYQRLTDEYHPGEYRLATYAGGLDGDPDFIGRAARFDITFNCKPQRFLELGEEAVSVEDGDTIINPTLFDASPMLEVEGYGTIEFNGYEVEVENNVMGEILIFEGNKDAAQNLQITPDYTSVNRRDKIKIGAMKVVLTFYLDLEDCWFNNVNNDAGTVTINTGSATIYGFSNVYYACENFYIDSSTAVYGTAKTLFDASLETVISFIAPGETIQKRYSLSLVVSIAADGSINFATTVSMISSGINPMYMQPYKEIGNTLSIYADSTFSLLGHPMYIDCDLGEAYKYEDDTLVELNRYIDLGSDLPKLAAGANTFEMDNTISNLKVVPRWWRL